MYTLKRHLFREPVGGRAALALLIVLVAFTVGVIGAYAAPALGVSPDVGLLVVLPAPLAPTAFVAAEVVPEDRRRLSGAFRLCGYACCALVLLYLVR